jgi:hypothetical protein
MQNHFNPTFKAIDTKKQGLLTLSAKLAPDEP